MLTFLRENCEASFNGMTKPCFAVLLPQLKVVLMEKCVQVPPNVASQLVSAYPEACVSGKHREFLKPESQLEYVPTGRSARRSSATDTCFKRALHISKDACPPTCKKVLEKGKHNTKVKSPIVQ